MIKNGHRGTDLDMYSPILQQPDFSVIPEDITGSSNWDETQMKNNNDTHNSDPVPFSIRDISSWLGGKNKITKMFEIICLKMFCFDFRTSSHIFKYYN